jgi:hypothetical protein
VTHSTSRITSEKPKNASSTFKSRRLKASSGCKPSVQYSRHWYGMEKAERGCRSAHAMAVLGPELHASLPNTRVLLVGAGGIGCELCKPFFVSIVKYFLASFSCNIFFGMFMLFVFRSKKCCPHWVWGHNPPGFGHDRPLKLESSVFISEETCQAK